ncbi:MAG: hypothetical protein ACKVT1_15610 [Dehalococcoidia bacterium]
MDTPEDTSGRRGCILIGALLGVGAGVLIALFAVPPLFDHYFGTADVALGDSHTDGGRTVRVDRVEVGADYAGTMVTVSVTVEGKTAWDFEVAAVRLELDDDVTLAGVAIIIRDAVERVRVAPGAPVQLDLSFYRAPGSTALPRILHIPGLKARFHLQPGEPE